MKIEIANRQRIKRVNLKEIRSLVREVFTILGQRKSSLNARPSLDILKKYAAIKKVSFVFCDNNFIRRLNKKFFNKDCPTDTISFPLEDKFEPGYLGEVVVSVEEAVKKANLLRRSWKEETALYITHGILHLLGYDDRTKKKRDVMEKKQGKIMKKLFG